MNSRSFINRTVVGAVLLVVTSALHAQTVIAPTSTVVPPADARLDRADREAPAASSISSVLDSNLPLWSRGPFVLRATAAYRVMHATNLRSRPGQKMDSTVHTIDPALALTVGDHWQVVFSPSWTYYSSDAFEDSTSVSTSVSGAYQFDEWSVGLTGYYAETTQILAETAAQTESILYGAGIEAHRRIGERTQFDISVRQNWRELDVLTVPLYESDLREWSASAGVRNQMTEKTTGLIDVTFGQADPEPGNRMKYIRPQLGVIWSVARKVTLSARAGWERREVSGEEGDDFDAPVFSASLQYRPVETTTINVSASRDLSVSYFGNNVERSTRWRVSLQQRLLQRLYFTGGVSWEKSAYRNPNRTGPSLIREDENQTADANLAMPFTSRGAVSIFYRVNRNLSQLAEYRFTSRQYGAQISFRF